MPLRSEEGYDDMFKKRFNVAASRARDQMWVVYSFDPDNDLKKDDIRHKLIIHARDQHANNSARKQQEQKTESEFERQVFTRLVQAGYRVKTQWPVGAYRIDMVVEGNGKRLAVECDGDRWHPQEKLEEDMARRAILERLGWRFVRIRGSQFFRNPDQAMEAVFVKLRLLDIPPVGMVTQSNEDADGRELKETIIRIASELRAQWKEQEQQSSTPLSSFKQSTKQTLSEPKNIEAEPSVTTSTTFTGEITNLRKPIRADEKSWTEQTPQQFNLVNRVPLPSTPTSNLSKFSEGASFNPILFLQSRGIKVIDNRLDKGGIWAVGGSELSSLMKNLADKGIHFKFLPGGVPYKNGAATQYRDGWFLRSYPD